MSVGSPTAGTWSSSQWRPDNEFETDKHLAGFDLRLHGGGTRPLATLGRHRQNASNLLLEGVHDGRPIGGILDQDDACARIPGHHPLDRVTRSNSPIQARIRLLHARTPTKI